MFFYQFDKIDIDKYLIKSILKKVERAKIN